MGCVDWNYFILRRPHWWHCRIPNGMRGLKYDLSVLLGCTLIVASLMGCVDWNHDAMSRWPDTRHVASLMGCVDWNTLCEAIAEHFNNSRIPNGMRGLKFFVNHLAVVRSHVASLMGCVDWNIRVYVVSDARALRRIPNGMRGLKFSVTWLLAPIRALNVASLMGCVDWNKTWSIKRLKEMSRIPNGMRGLKSLVSSVTNTRVTVASLMGCVDWNLILAWTGIKMAASHP